ncbi:PD40 domain-containing protein [Candidatus Poribacteria bacterium]|nr:PD40 domain-containing protein [Candidatus Poribacteria bacterium]
MRYLSNGIIHKREDTMQMLLLITDLALAAAPLFVSELSGDSVNASPRGKIAFSSLAPMGWDLYLTDVRTHQSRRLTEHLALDYNAVFSPDGRQIAFVSERDGNMELYTIRSDGKGLQRLSDDFALDDHPAWSPDGKRIAFVSTRQPATTPGQAWSAVYVMNADGSRVLRLSPSNVADYSPAWSPNGDLIAFASGSGKAGGADLFVMKTDGSDRKLIVANGGWPSFASDGQSLFFHSKREHNWGVWRINLDGSQLQRITPPDIEAFTPRASADGKWLLMAVRRGSHRQIELMDLGPRSLIALTNDATDHWNPSISADGKRVIWHKTVPGFHAPNVELWGAPPEAGLKLLRVDGAFPTFSPDGKRLAFVSDGFAHLDVMGIDGSHRKTLYTGENRDLFSASWGEGDQIAFAAGGVFQSPKAEVDLMAVRPDGSDLRKLTRDVGNNGFPAFSPDGKQLVFRSGREGFKNLYIINSDGTGLKQLTKGKWTDTMCNWSPAGEWIAFAGNQDGDFDIWIIRPDGSGLHKLIGGGGRNNHPHFSPDGKWLVFTSQRAGYSAEEISLPFQYQPYGDLFGIRLDGTGLMRLTHNGFEEGTPAWGP